MVGRKVNQVASKVMISNAYLRGKLNADGSTLFVLDAERSNDRVSEFFETAHFENRFDTESKLRS